MYQTVILYFLSLLAGVIVGDVWIDSGIWIVLLLAIIFFLWTWRRWKLCLLLIVVCVSGFYFSTYTIHRFEDLRDTLGERVGWANSTHTITGTAGELLSTSEFKRKYKLHLETIDGEPIWPHDIALLLPPNLSVRKGDAVSAQGKFAFPEDTPDYAGEKNLWTRRMIAEFNAFYTSKTPPEKYGFFVRLQQWFDDRLTVLFPIEWHTLLSGILLGQRSDMDTDLRDQLRNSGLMHLMVVSGGNVMMLIVFLSLFVRSIPVVLRFGIIGATIVAFVLLVWGDAPVWRAAMMGVIGYGWQLVWHRFPKLFLPLLVAAILALINPLSIVYDIGLQLSFLSVICIIVWWKKLADFFSFLGPFFSEATALTIAATIGTFPISLFYFGTFSLVSPVSNLLAAPAIPILMYGGIATLFASAFSIKLSYFLWYIPWIATTYLYRVIEIFGTLKWSTYTLELGAYKAYFITASLGLMMILILRSQRKDR